MVRLMFLCILAALSACASDNLPVAHGPWRPLNSGKWAFNENALTQPPMGLSR